MSKLAFRAFVLVAVIGLLGVGSYALAGGNGPNKLKEVTMSGYQENPDLATNAIGSFEAEIAKDDQSIEYTLSYSGLEGTVTQSHIHFGKPALNGGISVWLCYTALVTKPPAPASDDLPLCPGPNEGEVTGVIHANDVIGPDATVGPPPTAGQGLGVGRLDELIAAIRAGHAYANVHSTKWPGGEIRAQINDKDSKNSDD